MILAGDIGGTNAQLALFAQGAGAPRISNRYRSRDFPDLESVLARFLDEARAVLGAAPRIEATCLGIAGPVAGKRVRMTNLPWTVDADALRARFAVGRVQLLNDFAAAGWGLEHLQPADRATLQPGAPVARAPRVVLGAGTGLGIAYIVSSAGGTQVVPGEGGHGAFAPVDEEQAALWRHLRRRSARVTVEDVLSGPGLARIYEFVRSGHGPAETAGWQSAPLRPGDEAADVVRLALEESEPEACAALDLFIRCYGATAGDHALNVMARGGVYIAGGIAPRIMPRLRAGGFAAAFNDKGGYSEHARSIPVSVVLNPHLGLIGAAAVARRSRRRAARRT